jgi:DNA mismatch repair protein MutL
MPQDNKILRIPESVAIKIAAGEVIERPASVVKELVENSIDAGADSIEVEIVSGGKKSIRVTDNGSGIPKDQVNLALERFTTSKLDMESHVLENIRFLGFRGEALASISAVSHFKIKTRTHDMDAAASVSYEGGKIKEVTEEAAPKGTTIEVKNLFYNFPARRKFLKGDKTEEGHVESIFSRLALPYFDKKFTFISEGKKAFSFEKGEPLSSRAKKVFSKGVVLSLNVRNSAGSYSIDGLISDQGSDFPTGSNIITYINGRFVKDRVVTHAICEALRTHIGHGRYPAAVIFISMPVNELDVNVHPTKAEVKFVDSNFIHSFVSKSIQACLAKSNLPRIPSSVSEYRDGIYKPFAFIDVKPEHGHRFYQAPSVPVSVTYSPSESIGPYSSLSILGQIDNSYIICAGQAGLVIIDQHAAHERVTFERLKSEFQKKSPPMQKLLFPVEFEFKGAKLEVLKDNIESFSKIGFKIDEFGKDSFILRDVPEVLTDTDHIKIIEEILEVASEYSSKANIEEKMNGIMERIACHSSVRFSKKLSNDEIRALLSSLDDLENAKTCPHGRPFAVWFDQKELEKFFKRT